jgi:hypothetical protein
VIRKSGLQETASLSASLLPDRQRERIGIDAHSQRVAASLVLA